MAVSVTRELQIQSTCNLNMMFIYRTNTNTMARLTRIIKTVPRASLRPRQLPLCRSDLRGGHLVRCGPRPRRSGGWSDPKRVKITRENLTVWRVPLYR